jgi:hypothetical protein
MENQKNNRKGINAPSITPQPHIGTAQHIVKLGLQTNLLDILEKSNEQADRRAHITTLGGKK